MKIFWDALCRFFGKHTGPVVFEARVEVREKKNTKEPIRLKKMPIRKCLCCGIKFGWYRDLGMMGALLISLFCASVQAGISERMESSHRSMALALHPITFSIDGSPASAEAEGHFANWDGASLGLDKKPRFPIRDVNEGPPKRNYHDHDPIKFDPGCFGCLWFIGSAILVLWGLWAMWRMG